MMRAVGSASPMMRLVATTAAFASAYFLVAVLPSLVIGDFNLVLWPASGVLPARRSAAILGRARHRFPGDHPF